ncbi:MAG: hypothetical protein ACLS61_10400 [Ruminococcus sp.]
MKELHTEKKLVGRALFAYICMPTRPDLADGSSKKVKKRGWEGYFNQWVVDNLGNGDVVVADMFDKVCNGTFVGEILQQLLM